MINYNKLGFKAGIEVHQQLSGRKLFCDCPTIISKEESDFSLHRVLRASAGESGLVDKAAAHEVEKSKQFVYEGYNNITCLVEADEQPPKEASEDALITALTMAKLLNIKVNDCIQFMRKTVIDGSNTSGFQRTALIGENGWITIDGKKFGIESLCLEEEACQVIERTETKDKYNLSRLGIPLLEIATAPDMHTPEEVKKVAGHIGMLLRSLDGLKRGIGSIRQDVNVSIEKGARVEIKGFQDIKSIPKVINFEVDRQLKLVKESKNVVSEVRKAEPDFSTTYLRPMPGSDRMYPETDVSLINPDVYDIIVPKTLDEKTRELEEKFSLSENLASEAMKYSSKSSSEDVDIFKLLEDYVSENLSANELVDTALYKLDNVTKKIGSKPSIDLDDLFREVSKGSIAAGSIDKILEDSCKKNIDLSDYMKLDESKLEGIVDEVVSENKNASTGALMGLIMKQTKGKADGKEVMSLLKKKLN